MLAKKSDYLLNRFQLNDRLIVWCLTLFSLIFVLPVMRCTTSVVQLDANNFDEVTRRYELVFLNFYADWCRFSQILAPVFEESYNKVLQDFPEPGRVLFAKIDCEQQTTLGTRFHISKYPTLKLLMNGKLMKREFRGQRSVESLVQHVKDLLKDPIKHVQTFDEFGKIDENKASLIAYSSSLPNTSPEYNLYRKVSIDLRDDCHFYWVTGDSSQSHLRDGHSFSLLFKPSRTKPNVNDVVFPGVLQSYDELRTWATDKCVPLVREITFDNAEELTEEGLPFVILFHGPDDKHSIDVYTKIVQTELLSESGNVNFLVADGQKFAHPLHHLGKTQKDLPLIAIDSFRHMYLFPNFNDLLIPGKMLQFMQDLYSGKLHREFHFGPDPSTNEVNPQIAGQTSPPESTFAKLAPSRNRYTLLKDEL
ncbi:endoplasmic reticulum resident protein 44-like [Oppia nitens]|uniref:endoplasmic reticulum resident protein 44-like n=1 Tax=Oppia nitens TaxID=1686743 RepID=UPI0023DCABD2|nr:endoplasmic reticulum resident protein 44-like [Oppia nitens]